MAEGGTLRCSDVEIDVHTEVDAEVPLVDPAKVKKHLQDLVNDLENYVIEALKPSFKSESGWESIRDEKIQRDKNRKLYFNLIAKTERKSFKLYNVFLKLIAGFQPKLFHKLADRDPTPQEADFCMKKYVSQLQKAIVAKDFQKESDSDIEIDFNREHVDLDIEDCGNPSEKTFLEMATENDSFPDKSKKTKSLKRRQSASIILDGEDESKKTKGYKTLIPASNILDGGVKRVIMTGRPGTGKSETMQWLRWQWANGRWASDCTITFQLQLRRLTNSTTNTSLVGLLNNYSMFKVEPGTKSLLTPSWLENNPRVLIQIDGLDEVERFRSKFKNVNEITDMTQDASPLDLVMNIIKGNLLPECTLILTSRPFIGLADIQHDRLVDVLGLSEDGVKRYIKLNYPDDTGNIISKLEANPALLSVCSITWYCVTLSKLLNDDKALTITDQTFRTYTRLTAYIIVMYASRTFDASFPREVNEYLSKLAHLAYMGIFDSGEDEGPTIVFNQSNIFKAKIEGKNEYESIRRGGILNIYSSSKEIESETAQFSHLFLQEFLASAHLRLEPEMIDKAFKRLLETRQFNNTLLYFFGLNFDKESECIKCIQVSLKYFTPELSKDGDDKVNTLLANMAKRI